MCLLSIVARTKGPSTHHSFRVEMKCWFIQARPTNFVSICEAVLLLLRSAFIDSSLSIVDASEAPVGTTQSAPDASQQSSSHLTVWNGTVKPL